MRVFESPAHAFGWGGRERAYIVFSKMTGLSHTTLHRIERGEHDLTLNKLETVLNKLRVRLCDVFPDEFL